MAIKNQVSPIYTTTDLGVLSIVLKGDGSGQEVVKVEKEDGH